MAAPVEIIELASEKDIVIQVGVLKLPDNMVPEIQPYDPSFLNLIEPFLVIIIVSRMEIQHILPDKYELVYFFFQQDLGNIPLEVHDVVVQGIVPFAQKLNDAKPHLVINIQDLKIEGGRAHIIPLRVDDIIIYLVVKLKFVVIPAEER